LNSIIKRASLPFSLNSEKGELACHQLLRDLPGRRAVYRANFNGESVIAKCFIGKKAKRDYKREITGVKGFIKAGIATPALLYAGQIKSANNTIYVVVTDFIEDAFSFEELWKRSDLSENQRLIWLYRITRLLGKLYRAGVTPVDIHLNNLLIRNQNVYLIDGGGALVKARPLKRAKAIDNFTLFISVLAPRYDHFTSKLYLALANFYPTYAGLSTTILMDKVHNWRKWRERYLEKTLRTCSDFIAEKTFYNFRVVNRHKHSSALEALLDMLEKVIETGQIVKKGSTNTVCIVTLDDGSKVLIKRYQSTKAFSWLKMLKPSRARVSWLGAYLLNMLDVATPTPLAMVENRFGPLVTCSYIVTEYIEGSELLHYFDCAAWPKDEQIVVQQVKDILLSMERAYVAHGDLKATNFIVSKGRVYLIDLDSLLSCKSFQQYQPLWERDCERFMKNWQDNEEVATLFRSTT